MTMQSTIEIRVWIWIWVWIHVCVSYTKCSLSGGNNWSALFVLFFFDRTKQQHVMMMNWEPSVKFIITLMNWKAEAREILGTD